MVLLFSIINLSAQVSLPIDSITQRITYTEIIKLDSTYTKDQLYSIIREWTSKSFKSSQDVIQMDDKENGKLIIKALFPTYYKLLGMNAWQGDIYFTFSIYIKDGRYKYEVTNFNHVGGTRRGETFPTLGSCESLINGTGIMASRQEKIVNQIPENILPLINSLKSVILQSKAGQLNNDW
jgi:hypothetical protein